MWLRPDLFPFIIKFHLFSLSLYFGKNNYNFPWHGGKNIHHPHFSFYLSRWVGLCGLCLLTTCSYYISDSASSLLHLAGPPSLSSLICALLTWILESLSLKNQIIHFYMIKNLQISHISHCIKVSRWGSSGYQSHPLLGSVFMSIISNKWDDNSELHFDEQAVGLQF